MSHDRGRQALGLVAVMCLATGFPLAAGLAPPQDLVVQYPQSGTGLLRYVFVRQDTVVASMPSGEEQTQIIGRAAYLTLTWIASDSGTKLTAAIDSIVPGEGVSRYDPTVDSALGARWTAWRQPNGALAGLDAGPRSSIAEEVRDQLRLLFPILPPGGASPGRSWADSTEGPALVSAFEARERVRLTSVAAPGPDGSIAIAVIRERAADGEGLQYLQPIAITATGTDSLQYAMTEDGIVRDVAGHRLTHLDLELPAIGQRVSAHVRSHLAMRLLP